MVSKHPLPMLNLGMINIESLTKKAKGSSRVLYRDVKKPHQNIFFPVPGKRVPLLHTN